MDMAITGQLFKSAFKGVSDEMQTCIQNCTLCHQICTQTLQHCLQMGGEHAAADHVKLLLSCAEICETSANFMLLGSDFHVETCGVCADVCDRCAQDCDRWPDDEVMKICADACRRCAQSCRKMATH